MNALFAASPATIRSGARVAVVSIAALCAGLSVCSAHAHPAGSPIAAVCVTGADCIGQAIADVPFPQRSADTVVRGSALLVAANQSPQAGPGTGLPAKHPGIAGVIDRSVPVPAPANAAAGTTPEANLTQFNRLPEGSALMGSTAATSPALPDPDGGPVLYTIMERAPGSPQQVRPVGYTQRLAPAAGARTTPPAKRYCTVTELLRSSSAQSCR